MCVGQARLDALGTDRKGVAEKTELITLLEQPLSSTKIPTGRASSIRCFPNNCLKHCTSWQCHTACMARSGRNHSPRVCRPLSYEAMSLGSVRCILTQPTRQVAKRPLCESAKNSSVAFDWSSPACKAFSSIFVLHPLLHLNNRKTVWSMWRCPS